MTEPRAGAEEQGPLHTWEGLGPLRFQCLPLLALLFLPSLPCVFAPFVESVHQAMPWSDVGLSPGAVAAGFALVGVPGAACLISVYLQRRRAREGRLELFPDRLRWQRERHAGGRVEVRELPAASLRAYRVGKGFVTLTVDMQLPDLSMTYRLGVPAPGEDAVFQLSEWLDARGVPRG